MTPEERLEVETVDHKARVAWLFTIVVFALLAFAFWVTETPKRWVAIVLAVIAGLTLYASLR